MMCADRSGPLSVSEDLFLTIGDAPKNPPRTDLQNRKNDSDIDSIALAPWHGEV